MSRRTESVKRGDPHYFPDGRPKVSPDDTSMLGLSAVWSELDDPLPPRGNGTGRHSGGAHRGRASRRRARRAARTIPRGVMIGVGGALSLALLGSWVLISMFIP